NNRMLKRRDAFLKKSALAVSVALLLSSQALAQAYKTLTDWICPYISRHLLSLNPLLACCRRYSRGER
ncbi:hypothetical protein ACRWTN_28870, partial [Escherichia coli]